MEEIKLNEKHMLPGEERYFILEDNAGILTGTLYEPDGQKIVTLDIKPKSFDEVIAVFKRVSMAADKMKHFGFGTSKRAAVVDSSDPFFRIDLTPTNCVVEISGKRGSLVSLLATFLHINPQYAELFEHAVQAHREQKEKVTIVRTGQGTKYQA